MVLSLIRMTVAPNRRRSILEVLRFVERQTRVKQGCSDCAVYEARDQSHTILYVEQWRSREERDCHIRSDLYLRILAAMELSSEPPEIFFHEVSETKGIELIEG
ncbi:MAG TPA: antibiotic biosynthesis monooxygenase, partial [Dissulfurispiraceae bacterium]|nr:antibiotic biosynthesis monooxygenase [Dissulfurispiraceae bacterium]